MSDEPEQPKRRFTCSFLTVVFVQTLAVSIVVLSVPLFMALNSWKGSNILSRYTSADQLDILAQKIQFNEGSIAFTHMQAIIEEVESILHDLQLSMTNYVDATNPQAVFDNLVQIQKYKTYGNSVFYATVKDDFVGLMGGNKVAVQLPLQTSTLNCQLCQYTSQFTPAQVAQAQKTGTLSTAPWDPTKQQYGAFKLLNANYYPTQRPWFIQAAAQSPAYAKIQWTAPYTYQDGNTGLTAAYPMFSPKDNSFLGVYGVDLQFGAMQQALKVLERSNNTFVFVMTPTGTVLGTSSQEPVMFANGTLKKVSDLTDYNIHVISEFFVRWTAPGQDYTLFGPRNSYEYNGFYFQVRVMENSPKLIIVNGAPKSDFLRIIDNMANEIDGDYTAVLQKSVGAAVGVFIVMVSLACLLTHFTVTRTLRLIKEIMVQVRKDLTRI
ncbi:hypothetical protein BCR33DRAFT_465943 [Rhizoclosmatium globosum]|uniref:Cache domain-containing protein n=1 Tax=Rhizoclosmatium globosum TaxID=329046 RepID=A0A1Y2BRF9_9FUNG|nr:hypothetical protein BCR33DRAFT_465943 [Rhizoclosmatium globosum]|eukprot:ORY37217.1 hypothetical protein BCR33DRAFT_465943 [Rhizoclosmatium globosum]